MLLKRSAAMKRNSKSPSSLIKLQSLWKNNNFNKTIDIITDQIATPTPTPPPLPTTIKNHCKYITATTKAEIKVRVSSSSLQSTSSSSSVDTIAYSNIEQNINKKTTQIYNRKQYYSKQATLECNNRNRNSSNRNRNSSIGNTTANNTNANTNCHKNSRNCENSSRNNKKGHIDDNCCWRRQRSSTSLLGSSTWIFCLWLWIAISSMVFVQCIPSPSSSIQQPQKRGMFLLHLL